MLDEVGLLAGLHIFDFGRHLLLELSVPVPLLLKLDVAFAQFLGQFFVLDVGLL